jgi:hypothetical protein
MRRYPMVHLWVNGKRHGKKIHSLLALAFLDPRPTPHHSVAHNDGDPENCVRSNLRWATHRENHHDRRRHGTMIEGEAVPWSKLTERKVRTARKLKERGWTIDRIARRYDVGRETIGAMLRGRSWKSVSPFE